jgi:hypothetical protein
LVRRNTSSGQPKAFHRVQTSIGHFAICSFHFLALAEWKPILTPHGLHIARPEMMALANMLHHPAIGPELIAGTTEKRSNKDLGRVLALAWLTAERDRREGTDELDAWADRMADALRDRLPDRARNLALGAGTGLRELMASDGDRDEALAICNRGLLASMEVGRDAFAAIGRRVIQQVIEPLADAAQGWPHLAALNAAAPAPSTVRHASRSSARFSRHPSRCHATLRAAATAASTTAAAGTTSTIPASTSQAVLPANPAASHSTSAARTIPGGALRAPLTPSIVVQLARSSTHGRRYAAVIKPTSCPRRAGSTRVRTRSHTKRRDIHGPSPSFDSV